jgi:hypothetical protein
MNHLDAAPRGESKNESPPPPPPADSKTTGTRAFGSSRTCCVRGGGIDDEEQILALNNHANNLMSTGDFQGARDALTTALRILKTAISSNKKNNSCNIIPVDELPAPPRFACAFARPTLRTWCSNNRYPSDGFFSDESTSTMIVDENCDAGPFVYKQSMVIFVRSVGICQKSGEKQQQRSSSLSKLSEEDWCLVSYVIIYNLALCTHLIGIREECSASWDSSSAPCPDYAEAPRSMKRWEQDSQILYHHALQLLLSGNSVLHQEDHVALSYMAILNNMGSVQDRQGNHSQARSAFDLLFQAIICFNNRSTTFSGIVVGDQQEHLMRGAATNGFLTNIFSFCWPSKHNNAPAA